MKRKLKPTSQPESAEKNYQEINEALKRVTADFDNYRKRVEKDKTSASHIANSELILKIFPVLDSFRRAADHAPQIDISNEQVPVLTEQEFLRIHAYFEGMRQIEKQLEKILADVGLKRIATANQHFDHNTMEAISYEPHPELPSETVIDEVEGGYMFGTKVVRCAKVRVSKGTA